MPAPLRKIVSRTIAPENHNFVDETLECGHRTCVTKRASYAAQKRRCCECAEAPQPGNGGASEWWRCDDCGGEWRRSQEPVCPICEPLKQPGNGGAEGSGLGEEGRP